MTFLETSRFSIYDYLKTWQSEIFDYDKWRVKTGDHTKKGILTFYQNVRLGNDTTAGYTPVPNIFFVFDKMMIKGVSSIEPSYGDAEVLKVSATFVADAITYTLFSAKELDFGTDADVSNAGSLVNF